MARQANNTLKATWQYATLQEICVNMGAIVHSLLHTVTIICTQAITMSKSVVDWGPPLFSPARQME